jgi:hypothetical protein
MRHPWLYFYYRFDASFMNSVTQSILYITEYSLTISSFTGTLFSLTIYGSAMTYHFLQFHASDMTLFFYQFDASVVNSLTLSLPNIRCHSVFIDDFKVYSNCFRCWFVDQPWHSVFDNSMHQPWLYFCYRFNASVMNSLTVSITYVGCHSVFIDDFKVYSYSFFANDLRISHDIAFLTIPCASHNSSFAINLMRQSSIHLRCPFHTSSVNQFSVTISMSRETQFSLMIYGLAVT